MKFQRHTVHHTVFYNGKYVLIDYIKNPKDEFKYACMRIIDNNADGVVICPSGEQYEIRRGSKKAKLMKD